MPWFTLCCSVLSNLSEDRLSTLTSRLRHHYTSRSRDPPTLQCRLSVIRLISLPLSVTIPRLSYHDAGPGIRYRSVGVDVCDVIAHPSGHAQFSQFPAESRPHSWTRRESSL